MAVEESRGIDREILGATGGAIARLKPGEKVGKLLEGGYATISLGYIGLYELTKLIRGVSHTTAEGKWWC